MAFVPPITLKLIVLQLALVHQVLPLSRLPCFLLVAVVLQHPKANPSVRNADKAVSIPLAEMIRGRQLYFLKVPALASSFNNLKIVGIVGVFPLVKYDPPFPGRQFLHFALELSVLHFEVFN